MRRRLGFLARGNSATPMASGPAASKAEPAGKERAALTYQTTSMLLRFGNWAWQESSMAVHLQPVAAGVRLAVAIATADIPGWVSDLRRAPALDFAY